MRAPLILSALMALPTALASHPHVFVEAAVRVVFDEAGEVSVHLDWRYDEFFSLLVTSDMGLDLDRNMLLTEEEQLRLETEIAAWPPDFAGDLEVMQGGAVLPLGEKFAHEMVHEDGIFTERHARPVHAVSGAPLHIRVYDPAFYTAYDLTGPVTVEGRDDCTVEIIRADLDAAYALSESLLGGQSIEDKGPDDYFPAIGDAFADTIIVTCAGQ